MQGKNLSGVKLGKFVTVILNKLEDSLNESSLEWLGNSEVKKEFTITIKKMTVIGAEGLLMRTRKGQLIMFHMRMWYSF